MAENKVAEKTASPSLDADPVKNGPSYEYFLGLKQENGKVVIHFDYTCPARPTDCWVGLCEGPAPLDPDYADPKVVWKIYVDCTSPRSFKTDQIWGTNWSAVLCGREKHDGPYRTIVQTPVTV